MDWIMSLMMQTQGFDAFLTLDGGAIGGALAEVAKIKNQGLANFDSEGCGGVCACVRACVRVRTHVLVGVPPY